jgi:hypothetical protein
MNVALCTEECAQRHIHTFAAVLHLASAVRTPPQRPRTACLSDPGATTPTCITR